LLSFFVSSFPSLPLLISLPFYIFVFVVVYRSKW
jgi:hypothetical protein